jgi:hypothetical protein
MILEFFGNKEVFFFFTSAGSPINLGDKLKNFQCFAFTKENSYNKTGKSFKMQTL